MVPASVRGAVIVALGACAIGQAAAKELVLVKESRITALMEESEADDRLEASGVYALDGRYYVVFDNEDIIAVIDDRSWSAAGVGDIGLNRFVDKAKEAEGITYAPDGKRWLVVEEERLRLKKDDLKRDAKDKTKHSNRNGRVFEYRLAAGSDEFEEVSKAWLPYNFQRENKGFEGLSLLRRGGNVFLLALCEGNDCDAKKMGRQTGNGRIKVFARDGKKFDYKASIDLPRSLPFVDFSGMDVRDGALAVVSQESSALWVGKLDPQDWQIAGEGETYAFPKGPGGAVTYCNVEGVSWIDATTLVVVSDARKEDDQPLSCAAKEQSIHVFRLADQ